MDTSGALTAICRVAAVLAVAGVLAMHVLTTGHHAELPGPGGHPSMTADTAMSDTVMTTAAVDGPSTTPSSDGPSAPETLVGVCMAVLIFAATTLLLLLGRTRRAAWSWWATTSTVRRWALHVPSPRAPCLFTLGVLRA